MNNTTKKAISFIFLLIFILPTISIFTVDTTSYPMRNPEIYEMSFVNAEYLDADLDGFEDDTRFFVFICFNPMFFDGSEVKLDCLFEIILPSTNTFTFKGYIRLASISCVIQFDVYNTVSEPGWYTINFFSSVKLYNIKYTCYCTTIFDPPVANPEGGGAPSIGF